MTGAYDMVEIVTRRIAVSQLGFPTKDELSWEVNMDAALIAGADDTVNISTATALGEDNADDDSLVVVFLFVDFYFHVPGIEELEQDGKIAGFPGNTLWKMATDCLGAIRGMLHVYISPHIEDATPIPNIDLSHIFDPDAPVDLKIATIPGVSAPE